MGIDNATNKAGKAYAAARDNQYIRRVAEDEELRASLIAAVLAGRKAFDRISNSKSSAVESVTSDRKVKRELQTAAASLRDAAERIQSPPKKRRPIRKLLMAAVITGGLVLVFSESARKSVLDAVFGAEEEFVYTSTTSSPETNGTPVGE
ncbi:MAG: hypothetical protein M3Y45_09375 [Actinomycetota bacterium]|nr:hypothetical protein [Actinomycetota bacterium]